MPRPATQHEVLRVLIDRARRGRLLPEEADLLDRYVTTALEDLDRARHTAGGHDAAVRRQRQETKAAEAAVAELKSQQANWRREIARAVDAPAGLAWPALVRWAAQINEHAYQPNRLAA